jgi:GNAT superfamily N-acetyltransferase
VTGGVTTAEALPAGYSIRQMSQAEALQLGDWAAAEGWNPGQGDIDVAWACDPEAFIALLHEGQLVGGGAILRYGRAAGFMGLFILRPDYRARGLGRVLWHERLRRLRSRLSPEAPIGMDGVFNMAPFYAKGGFRLLHRDLRFEGPASGQAMAEVQPLRATDWPTLLQYDRAIFGVPRDAFLQRWIERPGVVARLRRDDAGRVLGYGVRRPCVRGFKIGPLFADTVQVASVLLDDLLHDVAGAFVQLDVPEPNAAAVELAQRRGWAQAFGCAHMVHGADTVQPVQRVFGVTSFEFG